MNNESSASELRINPLTIISWIFGLLFFAAGFVNTFWGGDTGFGIFIILLSLVYFLPVNDILKKMVGFTIPRMRIVKIVLGIFIIWATMGVGDLPDKVEMMLMDL
ncbi:hypothetical protein [Pontibacter roseus]|uniref:hypothetical protein n=1 Tax=Pontibacter roseus TaxID=336989 RepID=UPI000364FD80|nr:hypothetical protein [Pontibacter roseus]